MAGLFKKACYTNKSCKSHFEIPNFQFVNRQMVIEQSLH